MLGSLGSNDIAALYKQAYALSTLTERDNEDFINHELLKQFYGNNYLSSRAVVYLNNGERAANSGYRWDSVVNTFNSVFTAERAAELIGNAPCIYHYGSELYYSGVTSVIRVMFSPEYTVLKNTADEIVIREVCYFKDPATGEKTDTVKFINDNRFVKTSAGWRCSYFGICDTPEVSDADETDRFEQITDTSMPDLLTGNYDDDSYDSFLSPWKIGQRSIPIELMRLVDESDTEKWFESISTLNNGTPYRIDRGYSLYSYITGVGLSWEEAAPILEQRDFSADEISAMVSGNIELITKNSASEYTIVIGDCAYSPMWLYYHTTDDYTAVGIAPDMVSEMIPQYQKLWLPEEMWKAFSKKLNLFAYGDEDHSIHEYTFSGEKEQLDDSAFAILEKVFYGEWRSSPENTPGRLDRSFTYSKDCFTLEGTIPRGVFETDDIYILTFTSVGAATCYVIEKSAPDVMYLTDFVYSSDGNYHVGFDVTAAPKYIDRKAAKPEITSGRLSALGLKKLFSIYGRKFEESFTDLLAKDKSEGADLDGRTFYPTAKDVYRFGEPDIYLGTLTADEVRILMPYYCEDESGNTTELYAEMWFSRYYNGEWGSGTSVSIAPDAS